MVTLLDFKLLMMEFLYVKHVIVECVGAYVASKVCVIDGCL